jgi:hypothetical protein
MATFSPFGRGSLPWLGGGFNCYESFSGQPAPEKGQKNLKPPAALRGLASGGPKQQYVLLRNLAALPGCRT